MPSADGNGKAFPRGTTARVTTATESTRGGIGEREAFEVHLAGRGGTEWFAECRRDRFHLTRDPRSPPHSSNNTTPRARRNRASHPPVADPKVANGARTSSWTGYITLPCECDIRLTYDALLHRCGLPCVPSLKGRENVQYISLQHNLISRIDSLASFRMLKVLNLYDNKIERISGLDTLTSLRVLMLGKNRYDPRVLTSQCRHS